MSEKLYLPISILLSTLILSGTIFLVGGQLSNQLQLTGLAVAANPNGQANGGAVAAPGVQPIVPSQSPPQDFGAPVDMQKVLEGAHFIGGNEGASVKILEYSDFECPFCGRVFPTLQVLEQKYGNDVGFYYKHFPLSFHPNAKPAALASECAAEQGKFKAYHDKLFENQQALSKADLKGYAGALGLDQAKFDACLDSSKFSSKVDADFSEGSTIGVSGTPTFFINGQRLVGAQPQSSFESVIDQLLS